MDASPLNAIPEQPTCTCGQGAWHPCPACQAYEEKTKRDLAILGFPATVHRAEIQLPTIRFNGGTVAGPSCKFTRDMALDALEAWQKNTGQLISTRAWDCFPSGKRPKVGKAVVYSLFGTMEHVYDALVERGAMTDIERWRMLGLAKRRRAGNRANCHRR